MTRAEPGGQLPGELMVVRRPSLDVDGHGAGAAAGKDREPRLMPAVNDVVNQNVLGLGLEPPPILVVSQEPVRASDADHVREQARSDGIWVDGTDGRHERDGDRRSEPVPPESHHCTLSRVRTAQVGSACASPKEVRAEGSPPSRIAGSLTTIMTVGVTVPGSLGYEHEFPPWAVGSISNFLDDEACVAERLEHLRFTSEAKGRI